jgi:hypothetical protein
MINKSGLPQGMLLRTRQADRRHTLHHFFIYGVHSVCHAGA